ncbi:MAG: gliding motility-associated C-terminal domain-containing protein [Flavobacteriaceae bacterium]|jgi:gliding motility-associated-like protein|nr:gliding motility-associated C-terminal domain-containing protein [Flavobacteriaceae bacterium]
MKKSRTLLVASSLFTVGAMAQTVNKGEMYISPQAVFASHYTFENKDEGSFKNNGLFYAYADIVNNGAFFDFKGKTPQGKTILSSDKIQTIGGKSLIAFNDLELNNTRSEEAFAIQNAVSAAGEVTFKNGVAKVYEKEGSFSFLANAKAVGANDNSHIEGTVEKEGNKEFTFPIGDQGMYRYAAISSPKGAKDVYESRYRTKDEQFFKTRNVKSGVIEQLNESEYWVVDHGSNNTGDIILTLPWDERTTPNELLTDAEKNLHIVRWDEKQQLWVDEGGIVDLSTKTITTPTTVKGYGFFTFATVKTDWLLDGDVVVYNYVSTTGDGKNDYFLIDNINRFPDNKVEIFNRWGKKVFETTSYDSRGNVFKGYSDGKVTMNRGEQLPSGTYFYVLTYEFKDDKGTRTVKKAGYLHLETN